MGGFAAGLNALGSLPQVGAVMPQAAAAVPAPMPAGVGTPMPGAPMASAPPIDWSGHDQQPNAVSNIEAIQARLKGMMQPNQQGAQPRAPMQAPQSPFGGAGQSGNALGSYLSSIMGR